MPLDRPVSCGKKEYMLFLFNDVIFELGQPEEAMAAEGFPISKKDFARTSLAQTLNLAREAVFQDLQLPRTQPDKAKVLAVMLAVKTPANAILVGPPAIGAQSPAQIGLRLAEVSLVTLSHLNQLQEGGTLRPHDVQRDVWQELYKQN